MTHNTQGCTNLATTPLQHPQDEDVPCNVKFCPTNMGGLTVVCFDHNSLVSTGEDKWHVNRQQEAIHLDTFVGLLHGNHNASMGSKSALMVNWQGLDKSATITSPGPAKRRGSGHGNTNNVVKQRVEVLTLSFIVQYFYEHYFGNHFGNHIYFLQQKFGVFSETRSHKEIFSETITITF